MVTCMIWTLQTKLKDASITLSLGKILCLCPLFITCATDIEIALCMFKLCLNTRLQGNVLMVQAKADGGYWNNSIKHCFMHSVTAPSPLMATTDGNV